VLTSVVAEGTIALVSLHRPKSGNSYTHQMGMELITSLRSFDDNPDVRAIVVTGSGRHFCVGVDLDPNADNRMGWLRRGDEESTQNDETPAFSPWTMSTPVIGALNGAALGVGLTLPMQWDIRIAASDATLGFPFTRRGVIPEANSTWLLSRLIGGARALDLLLTGRTISGAEAASWGLVSKAVPKDELLDQALDIARDVAVNTSPAAVATTKRLVYSAMESGDRDATWESERANFEWLGRKADAAEGASAFLQKRRPRWETKKHDRRLSD
jgi:enoyl-CoA hydratase/carnithine racemase